MVDAPGLGPGGHSPWGFESLHPHRTGFHWNETKTGTGVSSSTCSDVAVGESSS